MPAQSRDKQFRECMTAYMEYANNSVSVTNNGTNDYPLSYSLMGLNSRGNNHLYELFIPRYVEDYRISRTVNNATTDIIEYREQYVTDMYLFIKDNFDSFFKPFVVTSNKGEDSKVFAEHIVMENNYVSVRIHVIYHKGGKDMPYPDKRMMTIFTVLQEKTIKQQECYQALRQEYVEARYAMVRMTREKTMFEDSFNMVSEDIRQFEEQNETQMYTIATLRLELEDTHNELNSLKHFNDAEYHNSRFFLDRLASIIREQYKDREPDDCPVCFDPISCEKLIVPCCGHLICGDCYTRCTACPVCRDNHPVTTCKSIGGDDAASAAAAAASVDAASYEHVQYFEPMNVDGQELEPI